MAHFAEIDENNIVLRVLVTDNEDPNGDEGHQWLIDNLGGTWVKTSFNTWCNQHPSETPFRKNFALVGGTYDPERDAFIDPRPQDLNGNPFYSWNLNEETCCWEPPVPKPEDWRSYRYTWDEESLQWIQGDPITFIAP